MSDVIGAVFEVGENSGGAAALATWIAAQVTGSLATNVLATLAYDDSEENYIIVLMSTTLTQYPTAVASGSVSCRTFDVRNGLKALLAWINASQAGVSAPSAPTLSLIAAGALTGQGTMYVKTALVTPAGTSVASAEASQAVTNSHELVVASPVDSTGSAIGWNVYIGATSGSEKIQNATPIALGTNYTVTAAFTTSGAVFPASNTSAALRLQSIRLTPHIQEQLVTAILSR